MLKHKSYIQILNVFSCFAVIVLHVNHCFWDFGYENYWVLANFIESLMYFAVPIFFMITGVTLMDYRKRYSTREYFQKRIHKVVIPYIIWSIIGILWMIMMKEINWNDVSLKMIIDVLMNADMITVYWYFIPLIAIYLSIPVLSSIPSENRQKIFQYIICFSFLTVSLLPLLFDLIGIPYNGSLQLPVATNHVLFVLIGYYIDRYPLTKSQRRWIYILGIVGFLVHWLGTWYVSYQLGDVSRLFKGYTNAPSVLYATAIFVAFKYMSVNKVQILEKITSSVNSTTFGIYLIHWFVIQVFLLVSGISQRVVIYRIIGPFFIMLICAIIVKLMQKIPILKKCVPA